ncbi:PAS domain S-box protein [Bacillus sp. JCM 19041]|uniref:PAS domain S-box protein n=1 Tax=Bacillus sp. JCM 19041 TaxID=1460637 RepID=UPI0006D273C4
MSEETNQDTLIENENFYRQIIEFSTETVIIHSNYKVLYINQSGADFLGAAKEDIVGERVLDIILKENKAAIEERIQKVLRENKPAGRIEQTISKLDGTKVDVEIYCYPVKFGDVSAIHSVINDITERKEIENEINLVSTPIVPLLDHIAVLPLVGAIKPKRVKQLLNVLPTRVREHATIDHLIIDVSGIYNFDKVAADFLHQLTSTMDVLGVETIITGIRPELALTAIQVGLNFHSMRKMATVKQALQSFLAEV